MFQGNFEHSIDEKGRIAVPSVFRKKLFAIQADDHAQEETQVVLTIADQCLSAYGPKSWEQIVAKIAHLNQLDKSVIALKRLIIGHAHECTIDKAGRILVPPVLRKHAALDKACVVIGQVDKFEIWSEQRWEQSFASMSDQIGSVFSNLADSGVSL